MSVRAPVRIAFRLEGGYWVGYSAKSESMDGAIEMGRIRMVLVDNFPEVKEAFKQLMCSAFEHMLKQVMDLDVDHFEEHPAPEPERSGHA